MIKKKKEKNANRKPYFKKCATEMDVFPPAFYESQITAFAIY